MATHCRLCMASNLEYFEDGAARCRSCGTLSPPAWAPSPVGAPPGSGPAPPPSGPPPAPSAPPLAGLPPGYPVPPWQAPGRYRTATFSSIFSDTFGLFARHPLEFFLPYFVFSIAVSSLLSLAEAYTLGSLSFTFDPANPATFPADLLFTYLALIGLIALGSSIVGTVVQGGVSHFAILRHRSADATLGRSFREGLSRILSLLGAGILVAFVVIGLFAMPIFLLLLGVVSSNFAVLGLGFLALIVAVPVAIYVGIALSLFAPAIMMERVRAVPSLRRSWALTKARRLSLFGAYFVIGLLAAVVSFAISLPAGLIGDPIIAIVLGGIGQGLVGSWVVIAAAVAYDLIVSQPVVTSWPWPAWGTPGVPPGAPAPAPPGPPPPPPAGPPGP